MRKRAPAEMAGMRSLVIQLMQAGASKLQVLGEVEREFPGGRHSAEKLYGDVLRSWETNYEEERASFKLQQIERIHSHIAQAVIAEKWSAVASLERLFAEVAGTLSPIRVEVNDKRVQREALIDVLYSLTDDELDEIAAAQAELEAAAMQVNLLQAPKKLADKRRRNGA